MVPFNLLRDIVTNESFSFEVDVECWKSDWCGVTGPVQCCLSPGDCSQTESLHQGKLTGHHQSSPPLSPLMIISRLLTSPTTQQQSQHSWLLLLLLMKQWKWWVGKRNVGISCHQTGLQPPSYLAPVDCILSTILKFSSELSTENNVELTKHNSEDLKVYLGQISIGWWLNTMWLCDS